MIMILNVIYLLRKRLTMKKTLILFALLLLNFNLFSQSKKEIIQTLNIRIDSLKLEITNRDIKFEKEKATSNSNRELMLLNISKLENTLVDLNAQIDSAKKNNEKLQEINEQLQESINQLNNKLLVLNDSIVVMKKENFSLSNKLAQNITQSSNYDFIKKAKVAFEKVKSENDYIFGEYTFEKVVKKDSFKQICGTVTCVCFVLTEQFLVMSYRSGIADVGTYVIDLFSGNNIMTDEDSYVAVNSFDKANSILNIEKSGIDDNGRYLINGTYNLKTKILQLGKKEY
jgi:predicted RNase H-like nuclease (RuvC/YqgF family)